MDGIEAGRVTTNPDTYRPMWMDIGGPNPPPNTVAANGGKSSASSSSSSSQKPSFRPQDHHRASSDAAGVGQGAGSSVKVGGGSAQGSGGDAEGVSSGSFGQEIYLARVNWLQDGSLCAQVQNRPQTELRLLRLDPRTGTSTTLVVERSNVWINLHHLLRSLPGPATQVLARAGSRTYLYVSYINIYIFFVDSVQCVMLSCAINISCVSRRCLSELVIHAAVLCPSCGFLPCVFCLVSRVIFVFRCRDKVRVRVRVRHRSRLAACFHMWRKAKPCISLPIIHPPSGTSVEGLVAF